MRTLLASPRRRRRVLRWTAVVLVVGSLVAIGVIYPNTGREKEIFNNAQAVVPKAEAPSTALALRQERAAERVLSTFIETAVLRRNTVQAYDITAPSLRCGLSRAQWRRGDICVSPFPAQYYAGGKLKLQYSRSNLARYEVLLFGKPHTIYQSQMYSGELQLQGPPGHRAWKVDYWMPAGGGFGTPAPVDAQTEKKLRQLDSGRPALSLAWLAIPFGLLSLVFLVPIALAIRSWLKTRRAERAYKNARPLPPLS